MAAFCVLIDADQQEICQQSPYESEKKDRDVFICCMILDQSGHMTDL